MANILVIKITEENDGRVITEFEEVDGHIDPFKFIGVLERTKASILKSMDERLEEQRAKEQALKTL